MSVKYEYKNLKIGGGGFVTGFVFHKNESDILYTRTDIGGTYKFDFKNQEWVSLIDFVTTIDSELCYPLSIALDDNDKNKLYIACGSRPDNSSFYVSNNQGKTYIKKKMPCFVHGNFPGRATGERLIKTGNYVFFASQTEGLFRTENEGDTFIKLNVNGEKNLTFVNAVTIGDKTLIFVGTNGEVNLKGNTKGHSVYASYDLGETFFKVKEPEGIDDERVKLKGFVAHRSDYYFDEENNKNYFFITFSQTGITDTPNGYTCDSAKLFDGRICRYELDNNAKIISYKDITPVSKNVMKDKCKERRLTGGISGVSCIDGMLVVSEINSENGDAIFASKDFGENWSIILKGLEYGAFDFTVPYMKPKYNGNGSLVHWMSDIKINPHNSNCAVFNTGTGVFKTDSLRNFISGKDVLWEPMVKGMEETVHLNIYGMPSGEVQCLDIVGDLGGIAYRDLDAYPENTFADKNDDRYITCLNADFSFDNTDIVVATPRGNWKGKTKGGVIISFDNCKSWENIGYPYGISDEIDTLIEKIKQPNVDSGWVTISNDTKRIIWQLSSQPHFYTSHVVYTDDFGKTYKKTKFIGKQDYDEEPISIKIFSDKTQNDIFMAVNTDGDLFISNDKGETFYECEKTGDKFTPLKLIWWMKNEFDVNVEYNKGNTIWAALGKNGLWKYTFDPDKKTVDCKRISGENDKVYGIGFGKPKGNLDNLTLFTSGEIDGQYGFYRSFDYGKTFELISDDNQHFGTIRNISGDPRVFSRFFIATGSRGAFYAEEVK